MQLACGRAGDLWHRRPPSPAGLVDSTTDDGLVELENLGAAVRKGPHLIRGGEGTRLQAWHGTHFDPAARGSRRLCGMPTSSTAVSNGSAGGRRHWTSS